MIADAAARLRDWSRTRRGRACLAGLTVLLVVASVGWYQTVKPLPDDLVFRGEPQPVGETDVRFLTDLSFRDADDRPIHEQQIFDEILALIGGARRLIVLDFFLFNDHGATNGTSLRPLSGELVESLIAARRREPDLPVVLVTDPINDVYGGDPSPRLGALRDAGIRVVSTDLDRLRDSNPLVSSLWRVFFQWWGNSTGAGWLPHPFDDRRPDVGLRTYLRLANFKANHRKVILADHDDRWVTMVTSANPHDASSAHSNVALRVESPALADQVFRAEMEVVRLSGGSPPCNELPDLGAPAPAGDHRVAYLTESAIRDRVLDLLRGARPGDEIDLATFYLSHRDVTDALLDAAGRGVWVRVVLDPNRDAFGHRKSGIPNRQTAERLVGEGDGAVAVRWYSTHGEQFHSKLLVVRGARTTGVVLGSANLTRRNLDDYNLEACVWVEAPRGSNLDRELKLYIDRIWTNDGGAFTVSYDAFRDTSRVRKILAWLQETTGVATF